MNVTAWKFHYNIVKYIVVNVTAFCSERRSLYMTISLLCFCSAILHNTGQAYQSNGAILSIVTLMQYNSLVLRWTPNKSAGILRSCQLSPGILQPLAISSQFLSRQLSAFMIEFEAKLTFYCSLHPLALQNFHSSNITRFYSALTWSHLTVKSQIILIII